ncbi:unnamed protein product [Rhizoctonia solani]|uniref:Uncharacterized protein n=1 Tax=Rhizoctonia solani TaxID=456999 RepID=A0A8H3GEH0_9AGAM|nr:unnamed protein product [Rhizoctonia solani]
MDRLGDSKTSNAEEWILFAKTKFSDVIRDLIDLEPGLLEFLMSADENIRNSVRSSLCGAAFPTTRASWLNSISCLLFQRFLAFFNRIPPSLHLVDHAIDQACRQVMPYMVLLSAIGQIHLPSTKLEEEGSTNQKRREACTTMLGCQNTSAVNSQLFMVLELQYPTTLQELQEVETRVLQRLEELLRIIIDAFETPELAAHSRAFVFGTSQQDQQSTLPIDADSGAKKLGDLIAEKPQTFLGSSDCLARLACTPGRMVALGLNPAAGEQSSLIPSAKTDWELTGRNLFNEQNYSKAMFCFEKANLLVEHDIAAAFESRKQARISQVSQYFDKMTLCAMFTKAGAEFLGCATSTTGKQQTTCYLHAAECYLQAEDWTPAAKAYYTVHDFDMAARIFLRSGSIDEAVEIVKVHRTDMLESITEDIIGIARLEYFRTNQPQKAGGLFDKVDEQLEYMENYGFTRALIQVLEHHGRYDRARRAIEQALRDLWKLLPFGFTGDKRQNPAIDLLIDQLSCSKMLKDEETRELEVFQALCANNVDRLFALAQSHEKAASDLGEEYTCSTLPLLCFSHSSRLLVPHRNSTISDFIEKAKLALSYIGHLLQFARSLDISSPSTQKLLGFEPVESTVPREDKSYSLEFWVHSTSLMFEGAQNILGNAVIPSSSALGLSSLTITELDARRLALSVMYDAARSEVRKMHNSANLGLYLYPCLEFGIFGRCNRSECGRQEVNSRDLPHEQRQAFFNQRTRGLVLQIQIVHSYQVHSRQNEYERRDFRRTWARRLYENLMPYFSPLGSIVCIDIKRTPEFTDSIDAISTWCEDALHDLDPGFGPTNRFLSDVLVYLDISFRINRQTYISELHSKKLARPRDDLMIDRAGTIPGQYSIVHDFINFYHRKSQDVVSRAIRAVSHIVFKSLAIEANALVNMFEFIGREMIVQWRMYQRGCEGVFDQLMVPRSWAIDLLSRPPLPRQQGISSQGFFAALYKALEILRCYEPGSSPLYAFNGRLGLLARSVLIGRICRLIVVVANGFSIPATGKEQIQQKIAHSLSGPGDMHSVLCAGFLRADSWLKLWNAVRSSPLNRGADELVYLFHCREGENLPTIALVRSIAYENTKPELERLLSFVEPAQTTAKNQVDIDEGDRLASRVKCTHPLTTLEMKSGKRILLCYRQYTLRQRTRKAVELIWTCYRRYRLRHKILLIKIEEDPELRKLHEEYKNDVESIDCPLLCTRAFRSHERILLGLMPHVLLYLRGLEKINQQEKEETVERLPEAAYSELHSFRTRMDVCLTLSKKIKPLLHRIAPGSPALHQIDKLKEEVKQVDWLRSEIMRVFGEDIIPRSLEEHYALSVPVILFTDSLKSSYA